MINIGQYIESAINWMMVHFSTFFDAVNSGIGSFIIGFQHVLFGIPFYITILALVTSAITGSRKAAATARAISAHWQTILTMRASGGIFGMKKAACSGITAMCGQTASALWTSTTATSRTSPKNIGSVRSPYPSAPQPHGRQNSRNDKICTFDIALQFGYSIIKTIRK